jgi:DNA-binding CsgD family transcriptional regulator
VGFDELRRAMRLARDVADLPEGSEAQRLHALGGLAGLLGAQVALWLEVRGLAQGRPTLVRALDLGWSGEAERRTFHRYLDAEQHVSLDPTLPRMSRVLGPGHSALTRGDVLGDGEWYRSHHVQELRRAGGVDAFAFAVHVADPDTAWVVSLHRPWGDRAFDAREAALLGAAWEELPMLHGPPSHEASTAALAALPLRLRQTLDGLARGLAEKELADELGLSLHTVHDYVKALHRRLRVRSRGELLALWLRADGASVGASGRAPAAWSRPV